MSRLDRLFGDRAADVRRIFSTVASWGGDAPAHCCWQYAAFAYDLDGTHVTHIRRLRGGDRRLHRNDRPTR